MARALDFVLRERIVTAAEALELSLVKEVVGPDRLEVAAQVLASEMAEGLRVAMRMLKRSMYLSAESSFARALDVIAVRTAMTDHRDFAAGAAAFRSKMKPKSDAGEGPRSTLSSR